MIPTPDYPRELTEYVHLHLLASAPVVCQLLLGEPLLRWNESEGAFEVTIHCRGDFNAAWLVPAVENEAQIRPVDDRDWCEVLGAHLGKETAEHVAEQAERFAEQTERYIAAHIEGQLGGGSTPVRNWAIGDFAKCGDVRGIVSAVDLYSDTVRIGEDGPWFPAANVERDEESAAAYLLGIAETMDVPRKNIDDALRVLGLEEAD